MIAGLGTDLVEVKRLRDSIERFGERFLRRVFTQEERRYCAAKRDPVESLAARFAAKEAAAKALGTGMSRAVGWQDFEVQRLPGEPPQLVLHGRARALAEGARISRISLSLTHTAQFAAATVIFECRPEAERLDETLQRRPASEHPSGML